MIGKFVLGPATDLIGGDTTLQITMAVIATLLYACAVSSSIQVRMHALKLGDFEHEKEEKEEREGKEEKKEGKEKEKKKRKRNTKNKRNRK